MKLPRWQIYLFDWDDTLVDSKQLVQKAFNDTIKTMGVSISLEMRKKYGQYSLRDSFSYFFPDNAEEATKQYTYYYKLYSQTLTIDPKVVTFLQWLRNQGYRIGIISNKRSVFLWEELNRLQIYSLFHSVLGSHDCIYDKPHPMPLLQSIPKGYKKSDVVFVGDSQLDMDLAMAGQVNGVAITQEPRKGATYAFKNVYDFMNVVYTQ